MEDYSMNAVFSNSGPEDLNLSAPHDAPADQNPGNIDKIRDILFGSNMRDYEQRFARLEEALKKESSELRDTTRRHLEALESFVHKELAALEVRLNTERDERSESHTRLAAELSSASSTIHRKIGDLENHEAQAKREIRNDLLQQSKELTDAIRAKGEELVALLDRRAAELQHAKTDRAALAGLFNEVALRLTDQFKVTGGD
jgi:DNA repair exonuclease SbcCD ATPase subunit